MTSPVATSAADYKSPAYAEMEPGWTLVRDIRGGTDSIRAKRATYLPSFEAEHINDYNARVGMTFAFDALDETIHAMVGIATRNDPVLEEDVAPRLVEEWENLDGQRTHGAVFAQHALEAAIQDGHCAILADFPPAPPGLTLKDEQRLGLRAYAVLITIDQITAWRVGVINGKRCLTMVKILETTEKEDGEFGMKSLRRYRVFRQEVDAEGNPFVTFEVLEEQLGGSVGGAATFNSSGVNPIRGPKWITLFPVYGGEQTGILRSKPPLRGLAYSNLDHTQVKSDRRYSMHKCAIPIPVFIGRTPSGEGGTATASSSWGFDVQVGGDFKWAEPTGTALQALRDELTDIERRMGTQGFSMLKRDDQAQKTATESEIEQAKGESKLSRAVRSLNDALEGVLQAFADFYGMEEGGSVTLQREFADTVLGPEEMRLLMDLEERNELTLQTLLLEIQKGGRMLQGVDIEKEVTAVEAKLAEEPAVQSGDAKAASAGADKFGVSADEVVWDNAPAAAA